MRFAAVVSRVDRGLVGNGGRERADIGEGVAGHGVARDDLFFGNRSRGGRRCSRLFLRQRLAGGRGHRVRRRSALRARVERLQHVRLGSLEAGRGLGIALLHAQHSPPRIGGLARIGELDLPHLGDFARQLGARAHVLASQDLVFEDAHHAAVVAELGQERRELAEHGAVVGRQVVELFQVGRGAHRVCEVLATQLGSTREQLADEGTVEHLFEHVR